MITAIVLLSFWAVYSSVRIWLLREDLRAARENESYWKADSECWSKSYYAQCERTTEATQRLSEINKPNEV